MELSQLLSEKRCITVDMIPTGEPWLPDPERFNAYKGQLRVKRRTSIPANQVGLLIQSQKHLHWLYNWG